jgi:hypothetical protein
MREGTPYLLAFIDLHFEKLVDGFFVVQCVHDREIDHTTQIHKICFCAILDRLLRFSSCKEAQQK